MKRTRGDNVKGVENQFYTTIGGVTKLAPRSIMVLSLGFISVVIILHLLSKIKL